jgi:hypothetical protein
MSRVAYEAKEAPRECPAIRILLGFKDCNPAKI